MARDLPEEVLKLKIVCVALELLELFGLRQAKPHNQLQSEGAQASLVRSQCAPRNAKYRRESVAWSTFSAA